MLRLEMSEKARKWMEEKHLEGTLLAEQVGTG
ncbi:hypothetical protein Apau_0570 [Aminomonas paucivorans DSM 12260]|uniref:Uncharacterized protein n=1 Tax=Aminomonas paucivorans DSM 12260 TaxID=584708 RepID=E3D0I4_9BACT|nr:hypothetical protein Apau_0570 [Aminomonas paucivorans DSM 12260]